MHGFSENPGPGVPPPEATLEARVGPAGDRGRRPGKSAGWVPGRGSSDREERWCRLGSASRGDRRGKSRSRSPGRPSATAPRTCRYAVPGASGIAVLKSLVLHRAVASRRARRDSGQCRAEAGL